MRALIAGATGFVGRRLAPALRRDGLDVRCLVRDAGSATAKSLAAEGCELHEADLTHAGDLRPAMEGVDIAYFLVHLMGRVADYSPLERRVAARFGAAARESGVSQLVYLGGLGGEGGSIHLRSRHEVAAALRACGPPLTYFRAAMIVGAGSESYILLRDIAERLPAIPTAAWMRTCTQPIGSRDVIAYMRRAPFVPEARGREVQIGGPRRLTPLELIDLMASALGRRPPRKLAIPGATPEAVSAGAGAVTRGDRAIAAELTFGLSSDTVVADPSGAALFDVRPEPIEISFQRAVEEDERIAEALAA
jgi:uncharacterized protein YbjT (DUF2867 family)